MIGHGEFLVGVLVSAAVGYCLWRGEREQRALHEKRERMLCSECEKLLVENAKLKVHDD